VNSVVRRFGLRSACAALPALLVLQPLCAPAELRVDLGGIAQRPPPPEFAFERFLQTRELDNLQFAPDNRSVYFTRNDGHVDNVFRLDVHGAALQQVTFFSEPVRAFLPDHGGRFLIVAQDNGGDESLDLYRFDLASGERQRLTEAGAGDTTLLCGLAPDDRLLYYAQTRDKRSEAGLWVLDMHSGAARELLPAQGRTYDCDRLSADGRYLLYGELVGFAERHLGVLDLDSGVRHTVARAPGVNNVSAYFADGQVYYLSALGSDRFRLWRYRIGAPTPELVALPLAHDIDSFAMYAEGRVAVIGYRTALRGATAVFVDGFAARRDFGLPPAAIAGAVFSDTDASIGVVATETASTPRRYYRVDPQGTRLLYDANQSGIDSRHFAEARSLAVPSFDGLQIPLHLFIPNATSACAPRPALVLVHGGPQEHVDPVYHNVVQFLANRGFIVVVPNVRGSTGFGKTYASLDDGGWGGAHVDDIVAVARHVAQLDFVDADNLFVAGESFGGFSVMSLLTRYPEAFRAAVDLFGFTELASFVASWPRFLRRHLFDELGFDPRVDRRRNRMRSPLYHVERIRTPLQIHQGANDSRVPREQSDWLVQRLRRLGHSVEYFVYPDEGHGFTRRDNEALAWERVVAFLRRWQSS
jgi:dipeptidyl aminopeptidase/acylaminoacyl peptidase